MVLVKKDYDKIATLSMIVAGVFLFSLAAVSYNYVSVDCTNKLLRSGLTGILAMGAGMATVGICYWVCILRTKEDCYDYDSYEDTTAELYFGISGFISLGLIILLSVMLNSLSKSVGACDSSKLKKMLIAMLVIASIIFVSCVLGATFAAMGMPSWLEAKKGGMKVLRTTRVLQKTPFEDRPKKRPRDDNIFQPPQLPPQKKLELQQFQQQRPPQPQYKPPVFQPPQQLVPMPNIANPTSILKKPAGRKRHRAKRGPKHPVTSAVI